MSSEFSYRDYVADQDFMAGYRQYQEKYAENMRQSDRVLVELIHDLVAKSAGSPLSLLDVGCSTGNLLRHLKRLVPGLQLTGGDLTPAILEECRRDPQLAGIDFLELDALDLKIAARFDFITINAVFYLFSDEEFQQSLASISRALKPGGWLLTFDFFHPFEQDLAIFEKSKTHPDGLMLHFRPYSLTSSALAAHNFTNISFQPFAIPIDLPQPDDPSEIISYTVATAAGARLLFRGALSQPWCHLVAQKQPA